MLYGKRKLHPFNGYHVPVPVIAAISAAATVVSGVMQFRASSAAAEAQQEAQEAQSRAAKVEAQRARIQQVREARIRKAQIIAAGTEGGLGMGTSGIGGAIGSVASQMAGNIGAINQQQTFAQQTSNALQKAADANAEAATWQTIGSASKSIFNTAGGFTTLFGGNTPTNP